MLFQVYAVKLVNGEKERYFLGATLDEVEAYSETDNAVRLRGFDYAYLKADGNTIYYVKKPKDYLSQATLIVGDAKASKS